MYANDYTYVATYVKLLLCQADAYKKQKLGDMHIMFMHRYYRLRNRDMKRPFCAHSSVLLRRLNRTTCKNEYGKLLIHVHKLST